jgi:hypothetical protein
LLLPACSNHRTVFETQQYQFEQVIFLQSLSVTRRHQCDYIFRVPELPSVVSTAALTDNSLLKAVDATDASKKSGYLLAVCHAAVPKREFEL